MATAADYSQTGARTANLPGRRFDHVFFTSMALLMLVTVFSGFAHTYYLAGVFRASLPSGIIHVHAVVFSCWILLLIAQTSLVSAGRTDIHRRLGLAGFFLACLLMIFGVLAATDALKRNGPIGRNPQLFYMFHLTDLLVFGILVYFAFRDRLNSPAHKRFIYIGTIALLGPAIARLPLAFLFPSSPVVTWLTEGFLLVLVLYDLWSTHRLHRATLWAGAFLVVVLQFRVPAAKTPAWLAFCGWVQHLVR